MARGPACRRRYVFHCYNLDHEHMAMMGTLETVV
jgi:FtsP/CotA-like multicopper oxidase with cupredoxin domain